MNPTVNTHPRDWCAQCVRSWGLDTIAVTVAGVTICDKCVDLLALVVTNERQRRESDRPRERRE